MKIKEYDNWLICLESDNIASFIKVWFAHLASMHDIVLQCSTQDDREKLISDMRGDGVFIKKYRDTILPNVILSESTKSSIMECYKISKTLIKANYPEYYHVTYYKKIPTGPIYSKEPISIQQDSYLINIMITSTNKLVIGVLLSPNENDSIPLEDKLKKRYCAVEIDLIPTNSNLWIIDDSDKFSTHLWYCLRKALWKNIKASEGSKSYENAKIKLDKLAFLIAKNYCVNINNIQLIIYQEKINKSATDKDIKDWFHEFTYSLRNVLFHRVVNPFDSNWTNIVKITTQVLHDIVKFDIQQLKNNKNETE